MESKFAGEERRRFMRLDYMVPLAYKVCKEETISKLLNGYTSNISEAGLLCNIKDKVCKGDILWLSFNRSTLIMCAEMERRTLIYQNGIIAKVVRIDDKGENTYSIGVQFITREEKDTHIYPKIHFAAEKDS